MAPQTKPSARAKKVERWWVSTLLVRMAFACGIAFLAWIGFCVSFARQKPIIRIDPFERIAALLPAAPIEEQASTEFAVHAAFVEALFDPKNAVIRSQIPLYPETNQRDEIEAILTEHASDLDALSIAAGRKVFGHRIQSKVDVADPTEGAIAFFPMWTVVDPTLTTCSLSADLLLADANWAFGKGEGARAIDRIRAVFQLAAVFVEAPLIIGAAGMTRLQIKAEQTVIQWIETTPELFSDEQLISIDEMIRSAPSVDLERVIAGETVCIEDAIARVFTDDGNGDGWFAPSPEAWEAIRLFSPNARGEISSPNGTVAWIWAPARALRNPTRAETMGKLHRLAEESRKNLQQGLATESWFYADQLKMWSQPNFAPVGIDAMLPMFHSVVRSARKESAERIVARTAVTAERFRRKHHAWPQSAADLEPWLGKVAAHPNDPTPLSFLLQDGECVIGMHTGKGVFGDSTNKIASKSSWWKKTRGWAQGVPGEDWIWFRSGDRGERWKVLTP